jgi:hypothetical protein
MGDIRIRVGVALDANVRTVYKPLVAAAQEAAQNVTRALNTGAKLTVQQQTRTFQQMAPAIGHPYRDGARQAEESIKSIAKTAKQQADAMTKDVAKAARERVRLEREALREIERDLAASNRVREREAERARREAEAANRRFARRTVSGGVMGSSIDMGRRMAGDLARGAGITFDMSTMAKSYVERQQMATQLANSAWIPNRDAAPNEAVTKRVDPNVLMAEASRVATATGTDAGSVLQGLTEFTGKTGDLATARALMGDIAKLSKATGANMNEMLSAAADVSMAIDDIPDKGKVVAETMRAIAGQGQVGAVEIRDMAKEMGKLASQAGKFQLEGSTSKLLNDAGLTNATSQNVAIMGAMAQAARQHGRATSTTAVNSSMAFIQDMSNRTFMKRADAAGLHVFADAGKTQIRDPKAILLEMMNYSRGNLAKNSFVMPNKNSRAILDAFGVTYAQSLKSSAGAKGDDGHLLSGQERHLKALNDVSKEYDKLLRVTMQGTEVQAKFDAAMNTNATKAQLFQNRMQEIADRSADKLLPALERLAPSIERVAGAMGNFLVWATEHPGTAIAAAITTSIAKAAIGAGIRSTLERIIANSAPAGGVGGAAGGAGGRGWRGALAAAPLIGAAALWAYDEGKERIDKAWTSENKQRGDDSIAVANASGLAARVTASGGSDEDRAELNRQLADLRDRKKRQDENQLGSDAMSVMGGAYGEFRGLFVKETQDQVRQAQVDNAAENERRSQETVHAIERVEKAILALQQRGMPVTNHPLPKNTAGDHPVAALIGGH